MFAVLPKVIGKIFEGQIGQHDRLIAFAARSLVCRDQVVDVDRDNSSAFCALETNFKFHFALQFELS